MVFVLENECRKKRRMEKVKYIEKVLRLDEVVSFDIGLKFLRNQYTQFYKVFSPSLHLFGDFLCFLLLLLLLGLCQCGNLGERSLSRVMA